MISSSAHNDVKIYNVSAGKTLPQWIALAKKQSLRYNEDFRRRIELIQDFDFPTTSQRVMQSKDGEFILATGIYPPQIKVYELRQLSIKFDRHVDCEIVQALMLEDDWKKIVMLQADRSIEFHSQAGAYEKIRIPKFGRDMCYNPYNCDLYVTAGCPEVYRFNLDQGRFLQPFETSAPSNNACHFLKDTQLLTVGGSDGTVTCIDGRSRRTAGVLNTAPIVQQLARTEFDIEVSALAVDGLSLAVGTSTGHVLLYDLRSSRPVTTKDHQYDFPINTIRFHPSTRQMITADTKIVKIWDQDTGKTYTSVEPTADINSMLVWPDSGLLCLASEEPRMGIYFIPSLGPAPKWASFLDNLTEELEEETQPTIYDDYKFVTKSDLKELHLEHLIGTNMLRAYMHGFFIDQKLYNRVKDTIDPFAYDRWRKDEVKRKVEEKRANRIAIKKRLPKVNTLYAEKLIHNAKSNKTGDVSTSEVNTLNPIGDDRFKSMFEDKDFAIDPNSNEYTLRNPVRGQKNRTNYGSDEDKFENFTQLFEERDGADTSSSEEEDDHEEATEQKKADADRGQKRKVEMFEAENGLDDIDPTDRKKMRRRKQPLGKRVAKEKEKGHVHQDRRVGNFEATIIVKERKPKMSERRMEEEKHNQEAKTRKRRGVSDLGLKNPVPQFKWKGRKK